MLVWSIYILDYKLGDESKQQGASKMPSVDTGDGLKDGCSQREDGQL